MSGHIKPLAKSLLSWFSDLAGVLGATIPERRTQEGVCPAVALDLKLLHEATLRMGAGEVRKRTLISSSTALPAHVRFAMAHESREQSWVLFLDRECFVYGHLKRERGADHVEE